MSASLAEYRGGASSAEKDAKRGQPTMSENDLTLNRNVAWVKWLHTLTREQRRAIYHHEVFYFDWWLEGATGGEILADAEDHALASA